MASPRTCPACGVVAPGESGRCPACGVLSRRRPVGWLVVVSGLLVAAVATWAVVKIGRPDRDAGPTVLIWPGITRYSPDFRGTDATATIENTGPTAVDVTLRARGLDIADRVSCEETLRPIRNLPPGGKRDVKVHFATIPLDHVAFEPVKVEPSNPDRY